MVGSIVCIMHLLIIAGKKSKDDEVHLTLLDKIYIDVNIFITIFIIAICFEFISEAFIYNRYIFLVVPLVFAVSFAMNLLLSITRNIKNKIFFKHTLICKALSLIKVFIKNVIEYIKDFNSTLFYKSISLIKTLVKKLIEYIHQLSHNLPLSLRMFPTPTKANDLENVIKGVKEIKSGNLDYIIATSNHGIYYELATDINDITSGLKAAVNNELKSERLKTELISNVSHDIRTPLTSIISYR